MSTLRFPRGSEWRRWDLHVHTPHSVLSNEFGADFDAYAGTLLRRAVERGIAVIGVTDYFTIEGYKSLRQFLSNGDRLEELLGNEVAAKAREILLIPNVELRSSEIVRHSDGRSARKVNFHVLFSDAIEPRVIEEQFLQELRFTAESAPDGADQRQPLTIVNLATLGAKLKADHAEFRSKSDLYVGMMNAFVSHETVTAVFTNHEAQFGDRYLFVVPADEDLSEFNWNDQGHLARKLLIQKSHMLFSSNSNTRAFALGQKHETVDAFEQEFKSRKPCLHGSDAHTYADLFEPAERRYLWIKGDPTFQGLRQLLNEPESRMYLGDEPPIFARVKERSTKYLESVTFERTAQANPAETWFSGQVLVNHGLVAIIGNKGSGKSALADILGLLGDTRAGAHFSFLTPEKFLAPKLGLGKMFSAKVTWRSADCVERLLDAPVDRTSPERVKYIPQQYLERICTEIEGPAKSSFDQELEDVIFSHVTQADRLSKETLSELVEYLTEEKEALIVQLRTSVMERNRTIVNLEEQLTPEFRKSLEGQLEQRRAELRAHDAAKPAEMKEPSQDPEAQAASAEVSRELEEIVDEIARLDDELSEAQERLEESNRQIAAAERLLTRIENLETTVNRFQEESRDDGEVLGLHVADLVTLQVDREPLIQIKAKAAEASTAAREALNPAIDGSLASKRRSASGRADTTRLKLDEGNRRYQEYLHHLAVWSKRRAEIEGAPDIADSIADLEAKVAALNDLPARIREEEAVRLELVRQIFAVKQLLLADYQKLHAPVQEFIDHHEVSRRQDDALQFSASVMEEGFIQGFLDMIHQGRKGSFQGDQDGRERLRAIVARSDFSTDVGVEAFVTEIQDHLRNDRREGDGRPVRLSEQLRQGVPPEKLYDFLYGLGYLTPRFELLWREKSLDQLSPGERGTLLLVFYLLIDRRDVPLIIDQPEENLDNETITKMMVPAIKHAKEQRQIIIVTHNPNLAVVCDADQIIHAHLDKPDGNRITYTTGSIEDPVITQVIVDVLEGTKPAFDLRDAKYEILEHLP